MKACSCCGGYHKTYDDGFDYLSCMGFLKFGMGKVDITNTTKSGVISTSITLMILINFLTILMRNFKP